MNTHEFNALKRAIAYELGYGNLDDVDNEGHINVDGVTMVLSEDKDDNQDSINSIFCVVELGTINDANRLEAYQDLLTLNTVSGRYANASFGYDADKDCAVLMSQIPASDLNDPKPIANLLTSFVKIANIFNERVNYNYLKHTYL